MSFDLELEQTSIPGTEGDLPNFNDCPLHIITATPYLEITANHPRRLLQVSDTETADYLYKQFGETGPRPVGITELWQALEAPQPFETLDWTQMQSYFGTQEMYSDPNHQPCIHGDGHQDRVTLYAAILGQYAQLDASDMKVLLVAASVHDRARLNDRVDPDHGFRAAQNVDEDRNYLATYLERGFTFTPEEVARIKLLCVYHEKPWAAVPDGIDPHISRLIQILQAADAADRYRSPNPTPEAGWWPKPEFFINFFDGDRRKVDAFLAFVAYFTLSSEKERFDQYDNPQEHIDDAIKNKAHELGVIKPDKIFARRTAEKTISIS